MFPHYLFTVLFMFPYMICLCSYGMNLSFLNEEVELGGSIREPGAVGAWDMRGLTLTECCTTMLSFPLAIIYQLLELIVAMYNLARRALFFCMRRVIEIKEQREATAGTLIIMLICLSFSLHDLSSITVAGALSIYGYCLCFLSIVYCLLFICPHS